VERLGALIPIEKSRAKSTSDVADAIQEHLDGLYRFALRLTRSPDDAQELMQETALRAWQRKQTITTNARAWLFQTLYHTFISTYRQRVRRGETPIDSGDEGAEIEPCANPLPAIIAAEDVRRGFEALPEELSAVVWLADAEGFSIREIAQTLDWPSGTVASRLWRGRQRLRVILSAYGPQREQRR
jgi:RNA polymerase sigma-70 factor (ECF subfamily)